MTKVWFTADTHFGHAKIIEYCKRPFASVGEMDRIMIERWNERVGPKDTIYHLGDFSFADQYQYFRHLNGQQKRLIVGNHDYKRLARDPGWTSINDLLEIHIDGTDVVLFHYGMRVWPRSHKGALHLYGHSHGTLPGTATSLDVGVDCWDFRPVSLDEIKARLSQHQEKAA